MSRIIHASRTAPWSLLARVAAPIQLIEMFELKNEWQFSLMIKLPRPLKNRSHSDPARVNPIGWPEWRHDHVQITHDPVYRRRTSFFRRLTSFEWSGNQLVSKPLNDVAIDRRHVRVSAQSRPDRKTVSILAGSAFGDFVQLRHNQGFPCLSEFQCRQIRVRVVHQNSRNNGLLGFMPDFVRSVRTILLNV